MVEEPLQTLSTVPYNRLSQTDIMKGKKIFFLSPYPLGGAPSQRFRYEQYLEVLVRNGFTFEIKPFVNEEGYKKLYRTGTSLQRFRVLLVGFFRRFTSLPEIFSSDFVFIHREATPVGPPIFEWIIAKVLRKKIIFDFDDAIWLTDKQQEGWLEKALKFRLKVSWICGWSHRVSCGNQYLADFALQFNKNVMVNPTTIDTEYLHNPSLYPKENHSGIIIGWTGSSTTLKYLERIEPVLQLLEEKFTNISFLIIADRNPALHLKKVQFVKWNEKTEIQDLLAIDIGLMPIPDDEWAKGKCGFKALQYMALEKTAVASPVGVNRTIIEHGENGFLADTDQEWIEVISTLIESHEVRETCGSMGRISIQKNYSVESNSRNFLSLFSK